MNEITVNEIIMNEIKVSEMRYEWNNTNEMYSPKETF